MEITRTLERQHREVNTLLDRFKKHDPGINSRRIVETIVKNLNANMESEESVLYPALMRFIPEEYAAHPLSQSKLRKALAPLEVDQFTLDDKQLHDAIDTLIVALHQHFALEEDELFPVVRLRMPLQRRKDLDKNYIEDFEMRMKVLPFPFMPVAVRLGHGPAHNV